MNRKDQFLNELDGKGKVFSALFGALTLFAILGIFAPQLYERMPEYTEWICGVTTWNAYNKQADMTIAQCAMLGIPVLSALFACIYVGWKRMMTGDTRKAGYVFAMTYLVVLCMFYRGDAQAFWWLFLWAVLFVGYVWLGKTGRTERFITIVTSVSVCMLAMMAGVLFLSGRFVFVGKLWERFDWILILVTVLLFFALVAIKKCDAVAEILFELQILLPFAWLGMIHFRYRYENDGSLLELFGSGRWKWACVLLCVLLLGICIVERRKKGRTVYFTTYIMTAAMRVFSQPEGVLNIDYFHNGEITMPMQQLVSYGKIPYRDLIPIHGMCDYYYGVINYLFFDGTYLSLNAAKVVGDLLAAALLAAVLYFISVKKERGLAVVYFFVPFMVSFAGMRYWFLFVMFFILFSVHVKKGMQSLYVWIGLSMIAIAWNASIGGAAAIAFLPVILYRLVRDIPSQWKELCYCKDKKKRNCTWMAWGVLVAAGMAYVPLFLRIVSYLKENTGTTLYVNGMEMLSEVSEAASYFVPGVINGQGSFWFHTFAFLIPLLVAFVLLFYKEKCGAGEMFVTYLPAFWVLANYSFVRYDDGLRTKVLGIFFLLLTAMILADRLRGSFRTVLCAGLFAGAVLLLGNQPFTTADTLVLEKKVPATIRTEIMGKEIDDPVVHVSGELVSMPSLGTGFVQGNTLASLQNVNALVQAAKQNGQTVFDITNAVANAVTLDMPLYLPYSSAYNISNAVMQDNAIELLQGKLPDIILAAPEIRFDDAPFSFRSIHLYNYLMKQDYVPYKYENVIYLVRGQNPLPQAQQNTEAFAQLMHKKDLGALPAVWGSNAEKMSQALSEVAVTYHTEPIENGIRIVFDTPVDSDEIAMVGITGIALKEENREPAQNSAQTYMKMTVPSYIASEGQAEFEFICMGDSYLIPVCCSPYVTESGNVGYLDLTSESVDVVSMEAVTLQWYQW